MGSKNTYFVIERNGEEIVVRPVGAFAVSQDPVNACLRTTGDGVIVSTGESINLVDDRCRYAYKQQIADAYDTKAESIVPPAPPVQLHPDTRPQAQVFYDALSEVIAERATGLSNAEIIGCIETLKLAFIEQSIKNLD